MGYRSQVRSLIYGEPEKICTLVAAHALRGGRVFTSEWFGESLKRYRVDLHMFDSAATQAQEPDANGGRTCIYKDVEVEVIDLSGDGWKWYDGYEDVKAWHALLAEAAEMELNTEFVRIGEDANDVQVEEHFPGDWCENLIGVSSSIYSDIPDDIRPVDYTADQQAA